MLSENSLHLLARIIIRTLHLNRNFDNQGILEVEPLCSLLLSNKKVIIQFLNLSYVTKFNSPTGLGPTLGGPDLQSC